MAEMKQLDLLQEPDGHDAPPRWRRITTGARRYRWRIWPARIPDHWRDQRDPHHPHLWYRPPPGWAYEVEHFVDCHGWQRTRNPDTRWRIWQEARRELEWE